MQNRFNCVHFRDRMDDRDDQPQPVRSHFDYRQLIPQVSIKTEQQQLLATWQQQQQDGLASADSQLQQQNPQHQQQSLQQQHHSQWHTAVEPTTDDTSEMNTLNDENQDNKEADNSPNKGDKEYRITLKSPIIIEEQNKKNPPLILHFKKQAITRTNGGDSKEDGDNTITDQGYGDTITNPGYGDTITNHKNGDTASNHGNGDTNPSLGNDDTINNDENAAASAESTDYIDNDEQMEDDCPSDKVD